jgi:putative hydrolase of the HAD superfamily
MPPIEAVIFDLDYCLFDEGVYVDAAFHSIARFLSSRSRFSEKTILRKLRRDFRDKGSMYPRLFNDAVADLGLDQALVGEILDLYGSVDVSLVLFSGAEAVLSKLKRLGLKLALVTNGMVRTQRNKVRLLGVEKFFDVIVYARECVISEKPNPEVYRIVLKKLGVYAERALCVGDNPYTDFWGAKKLGMQTMRLLLGPFEFVRLTNEYEAEIRVDALDQIAEIVEQNNCQFV